MSPHGRGFLDWTKVIDGRRLFFGIVFSFYLGSLLYFSVEKTFEKCGRTNFEILLIYIENGVLCSLDFGMEVNNSICFF